MLKDVPGAFIKRACWSSCGKTATSRLIYSEFRLILAPIALGYTQKSYRWLHCMFYWYTTPDTSCCGKLCVVAVAVLNVIVVGVPNVAVFSVRRVIVDQQRGMTPANI